MRIQAALVVLSLTAALGGCGQKGALYLPDAAPKAVPAAPSGKAPTTPAGPAAPASPASPATPGTPAADDPAARRKTPTLPDPESSQ
jgi:predicted small lipoprotein YifL